MENHQLKELNSIYLKGLGYINDLKKEKRLPNKSAKILTDSFTELYYQTRRRILLNYFSDEIVYMLAVPFSNIYKQLLKISQESLKESLKCSFKKSLAYEKFE